LKYSLIRKEKPSDYENIDENIAKIAEKLDELLKGKFKTLKLLDKKMIHATFRDKIRAPEIKEQTQNEIKINEDSEQKKSLEERFKILVNPYDENSEACKELFRKMPEKEKNVYDRMFFRFEKNNRNKTGEMLYRLAEEILESIKSEKAKGEECNPKTLKKLEKEFLIITGFLSRIIKKEKEKGEEHEKEA